MRQRSCSQPASPPSGLVQTAPRSATSAAGALALVRRPQTDVAIGGIGLLVAAVLHLPTLGQPLLEVHPFRQTQTAFTALIFHEQGIDLLHPKLPVLGAPWEVPLELPLFQALASLLMDAGLGPDAASRAMGLLMFLVTAVLTWTLARRAGGRLVGLIALGAFLLSPLALLWSRAALIEYLATALGLGYVLMSLSWTARSGSWVRWSSMITLGALAMMVKVTTGALYLIPIVVMGTIALRAMRSRQALTVRVVVLASLALIVPMCAGLLWTRHADEIKAASEFTVQFTSANLTAWNFGTLAQKLDIGAWAEYLGRANILAYGGLLVVWTPLTIAAGLRSSTWGLAISSVVAVWAAPVVFTNLYFVHDYYLTAPSPFVAIGFGLGLDWLRRNEWSVGRVHLRGTLVAAICLFFWAAAVVRGFSYWGVQYQGTVDSEGALIAAADIARETAAGERVVVTSRDWSPAAPYYARSWVLMWTGSVESATTESQLARFRGLGYTKLLDCPWAHECTITDLRVSRATILEQLRLGS